MKISETTLPGVLVIEPTVFGDQRGFFKETWQLGRYRDMNAGEQFVQDNLSRSRQGTLRGLHYQMEHTQGKLMQALIGEIYDVVVDLRKSSPTFGQSHGEILSADNHKQLYVPPGFAHGFYVMSESADVFYKCTDIYHPASERSLLWNDPALKIDWPITGEPLLSEKDKTGKPFAEAEYFEDL